MLLGAGRPEDISLEYLSIERSQVEVYRGGYFLREVE
jgi:hypothetical protein